MKKVFYLSTCSTCRKILADVNFPKDVELFDLKNAPISEVDLEYVYKMAGSYEKLFSKKAQKYSALKDQLKSESDYKYWLLKEYTFLKRPVIVYLDFISVGNDKEQIQHLKAILATS
ncbi:MAG: hypothetical protein EB023_09690 [Flavobacteriia bacterium]|nr:hypothetical protein [Flavobacteriia bacterium]